MEDKNQQQREVLAEVNQKRKFSQMSQFDKFKSMKGDYL